MPREFSAAMRSSVDTVLRDHLIRTDEQEDLAFALWTPSSGSARTTALIHTVLLPKAGDRSVHGNVSFNQQFFEHACREALAARSGIAFLHSHPHPGWQGMSPDDVVAEKKLAGAAAGLTDLPLIGLTVGSDGTWSGRFWNSVGDRVYTREWCSVIRVVGQQLAVSFADAVVPRPAFRELFRRTVSVWGSEAHMTLARLRIGIVGLGSVGALVAESLARMGLTKFILIDHDRVESHNLDRLVNATTADIGRHKVDVSSDRIGAVATAESVEVRAVEASVAEEAGYLAALDCDVIFSCVDRPRARHIMNHFAYAHLIPVVDGGIGARFKRGQFTGVDWQTQTVGPGRPCLECLRAYDLADVSTEAAGMLDDPSYLAGLPDGHRLRRNENVFPFSANLASLEVLQLIALVTGAAGIENFGVQRYRYVPGIVEQLEPIQCGEHCYQDELVGTGDFHFTLIGRDLGAERARVV